MTRSPLSACRNGGGFYSFMELAAFVSPQAPYDAKFAGAAIPLDGEAKKSLDLAGALSRPQQLAPFLSSRNSLPSCNFSST